jgi:flagellar biosynthesis protein FliR
LLGWAALAGWELVVGTLLGALVSLPGYAVLGAGSTVALVTRSGAAPVTGLAVAVTTMAALALALHRPLLLGLVGSFEALPLGEPMTILGTGANALQSLGRALQVVTVLALALATPVLLTAMVVDVGLALLGRGPEAIVPATEAMRAWARSALALIALGASWAAYAEAWSRAAMPPQ